MGIRPNVAFDVRREAPAETLERFTLACLQASVYIPEPARLTITTNLHSDLLSLEAPTQASEFPAQVAQVLKRLMGDSFERIESLSAIWNPNLNAALCEEEQGPHHLITVISKGQYSSLGEYLVSALRKHFEPQEYILEPHQGPAAELREVQQGQQEVLAKREAELLSGHRELRDSMIRAQSEIQIQIQQAREQFEERDQQREAGYRERIADLEQREQSLRQERAELDGRKQSHARRKLQESFQAVLERHREFSRSGPAPRKRIRIHIACWTLFAAAIGLYVHAVFQSSGPRLYAVVPALLVFGATLTFYVLWMKAWWDAQARAAAAAQTFEEDFSRAYWLAEFMFEWGELPKQPELPPEALEAFSRGLFTVDPESQLAPENPMKELLGQVPDWKKFSEDKASVSVKTDEQISKASLAEG